MRSEPAINNEFYDELGERWYCAQDDPVALLRAEAFQRNPWVLEVLRERFKGQPCRFLDIACGAGFLANALAQAGHDVLGIDSSPESLEVARRHDVTRRVEYREGDAYELPFGNASFDAVGMMDFLEHVERPGDVVADAARVLKPGGLLFFHTFNRNFLSWLIVIKGVEWFVANTPKRMHVYRLFLKPGELAQICASKQLRIVEWQGSRPVVGSKAFWKMLLTRRVPQDFAFTFTSSKLIAYTGYAQKIDSGDRGASA